MSASFCRIFQRESNVYTMTKGLNTSLSYISPFNSIKTHSFFTNRKESFTDTRNHINYPQRHSKIFCCTYHGKLLIEEEFILLNDNFETICRFVAKHCRMCINTESQQIEYLP